MKITLYFLLFLFVSNICLAQQPTAEGNYCFDGNNNSIWGYIGFYRDTINNPNNIWQIGKPHKLVFDSASSSQQNVLITDTINSYPINDTSRFIIEEGLLHNYYDQSSYLSLGSYYYVNSDTLNDYGTIEISIKNSNVWYDVLNDTSFNFFLNTNNKPILTGNSNGWKSFALNCIEFVNSMQLGTLDTLLFRFSFISDSIQTNKDGLMYKCFYFYDLIESVNDITATIPSSVYPNPAFDHITLKTPLNQSFKKMNVDIFESTGRKVESLELPYQEALNISVNDLADGLYYYKAVYDNRAFSNGKFTVMR